MNSQPPHSLAFLGRRASSIYQPGSGGGRGCGLKNDMPICVCSKAHGRQIIPRSGSPCWYSVQGPEAPFSLGSGNCWFCGLRSQQEAPLFFVQQQLGLTFYPPEIAGTLTRQEPSVLSQPPKSVARFSLKRPCLVLSEQLLHCTLQSGEWRPLKPMFLGEMSRIGFLKSLYYISKEPSTPLGGSN